MIDIDLRLPLARFTLAVRCTLQDKVTALVGPSGSGKTSLIEALAGLRPRATGRITIDGEDIAALPPERRRIGYVPQDIALFPHLRVKDNIRFGGRDDGRMKALCATLALDPLLDRSPASLSGGERQRVALARALMTEPRLLLLDEPLASVDQPLRERILLYLRRVRDLGVPMIYVTHQPFEALALSTWCVALRDGAVAAAGPSRQVLSDVRVAGEVDNVFEVGNPRHDPERGVTKVTTTEGLELVLAFDDLAGAAFPLVVRISADDIVVFGERPSSISSRNLLEGIVAAMRSSDGTVDLTVHTPVPIRVRLTRAAADDLRLSEGVRVWLALRSRAFRIVG